MNLSKLKSSLFKFKLPLIIFALALIPRLIWLDIVPTGVTNDELDYLITAKVINLTGTDLSENWRWWAIESPSSKTVAVAEITSFILSPFIGPFSFGLLSSKYIYALAGVALVLVWYKIFQQLIPQKAAFIAGLVLALNPWAIHFSRTAFEAPLALLFYSLSIYILLSQKNNIKFLSLFTLTLGFLSYHGTKLLAVPLLILVSAYLFLASHKQTKSKLLAINLIAIVMFGTYMLLVYPNSALKDRSSEIIFNNSKLSEIVDNQRKFALPLEINAYLINKLTVTFSIIFENYINAFNLKTNFVTGESMPYFSFNHHGYFYVIEIIFLGLGLGYLFRHHQLQKTFLILGLLLLAPLPAALSGQTYVLRAGLMYPVLTGIIALGIYYLIWKVAKNYSYILMAGALIAYLGSVTFFLHNYFFRYPVYASSAFNLPQRLLMSYISRITSQSEAQVVVVSNEPRALFDQFIFYNIPNLDHSNLDLIKQSLVATEGASYEYGSVSFVGDCPDNVAENTILVTSRLYECSFNIEKEDFDPRLIRNVSDAGIEYQLYQDFLCNGQDLKGYTLPTKMSDFRVELLSDAELCQRWITVP